MLDVFLQFVLELVRALLVDELSGHVRRRITRWLGARGARDSSRAVFDVYRRNRERLLNRLLAEIEDEL